MPCLPGVRPALTCLITGIFDCCWLPEKSRFLWTQALPLIVIVVSVREVSSVFDLVSLVFLISTLGELVSSFRFAVAKGVSLFSAGFSCVGGLEVCGLGVFSLGRFCGWFGVFFFFCFVFFFVAVLSMLLVWLVAVGVSFGVLSGLSVSMSSVSFSSFSSLSDSQIPLVFSSFSSSLNSCSGFGSLSLSSYVESR